MQEIDLNIEQVTENGELMIDGYRYQPPFEAVCQQTGVHRTGKPEVALVKDRTGKEVARFSSSPGRKPESLWKRLWAGGQGAMTEKAEKVAARLNQEVVQSMGTAVASSVPASLEETIKKMGDAEQHARQSMQQASRKAGEEPKTASGKTVARWIGTTALGILMGLWAFGGGISGDAQPEEGSPEPDSQKPSRGSSAELLVSTEIMTRGLEKFSVLQQQRVRKKGEPFDDPGEVVGLTRRFHYRYSPIFHEKREVRGSDYVVVARDRHSPASCVLNHTTIPLGPRFHPLPTTVEPGQIRCQQP